ncbi:MAG: S8 family serine peptidase [Gemmatimonadaceae bacterium]|nr:S8 family serine peptidase [Gemmatimonadaceae bacterium]
MTSPRRFPRALLLLAPLWACTTDPTSAPRTLAPDEPSLAISAGTPTDRYLVQLAPGAASVTASIASVGAAVQRSVPALGLYEVSGLDDAGAQSLRARSEIVAVARDMRQQFVPAFSGARVQSTPGPRPLGSDQSGAFFYPVQWNMHRIQAQAGWAATPGGAGALVCVLDTGVDPGQADLLGKVDLGKSASMVPSEPFIEDLHFHGTYVSSLVSSNGIGMASVAPDAQLCAVKVLDANGSGNFFDLIGGIVHAADVGADVINMSLRGFVDLSDPNGAALFQLLGDAARYARQKGTLLLAATGNDALNIDQIEPFRVIPAQTPGVTGITATKQGLEGTEAIAPYSNVGNTVTDITAPGGDFNPSNQFDFVLGACSRYVCGADNFYLLASGTSAASPHVAGVAALAESFKAGNQNEDQLRACLARGAEKLRRPPRSAQGLGRINALLTGVC